LAAEANRLFIENRDFETAALLALRSLSLQYTAQGDEALSRASRLVYPAREWSGHVGEPRPMAFSADGKLMVSGDGSGTPIWWDVATGKILQQFKGHTGVAIVTISPDGKRVVTGSDDGTMRVWDTATGQELHKRDYGAAVWAVAVTADGQLFVGGWDKILRVLDLATGEEIKQFDNGSAILGIAISPDGRLVLTGCDNGLVQCGMW
jgi:WD40 repeat protein